MRYFKDDTHINSPDYVETCNECNLELIAVIGKTYLAECIICGEKRELEEFEVVELLRKDEK